MHKDINTAVEELENTDIKNIGEARALEKASNVKQLLNRRGIPTNDAYRKKVGNFVSTVRTTFELENQDTNLTITDFLHYGRAYVGDLDGYRLIVRPSFDTVFLSTIHNSKKPYNGIHTIRLSWKLNIAGRIELTDCYFPSNRKRELLITICGYEQIPSRWDEHAATYYEFPEQMPIANPIFEEQLSLKQYVYLLDVGYEIAQHLYDCIHGHLPWPTQTKKKPDDRNLADIANDKSGKYIINQAAHLDPIITLTNTEGIFVIKYKSANPE